ncbi:MULTISPECIES: RNA polymerase sigma factor [Bacillaceae]|uniref:RNA polymerase sigma factor n=1 Tax=Evansella alkalicola TaxID=745819 RepID=A0ABS6JR81_9BACI|nr:MULTISPECIES: RNA polymerase sigma factor [Bacillaceae]MBU9720772.1 RNA polymerase sigma factor [Bacillus alkalicola]
MDDKQLIEDWFLKYQKYITTYLVYYTGKKDVEDLVQECFLKAYQKLHLFHWDSDPKTWLISIARNLAIDLSRKRKIISFLPIMTDHPSPLPNTEETVIHKDEILIVEKAIKSLSRTYRDVLILKGIMDFSSKETATILNCSENRVNVTFHRGIEKLKRQLRKDGDGYVQQK